jgi:hypothetical protein
MARKFQFQKVRTSRSGRKDRTDDKDRQQVFFEPVDVALLVLIVLIVFWLQWLMGALSG